MTRTGRDPSVRPEAAPAAGRWPPALRGAEAVVNQIAWLDRVAVSKDRLPKAYRHPALDGRLRTERTRDEANLLVAARRAGVRVPVVYTVDRGAFRIAMEKVSGMPLRHALERDAAAAATARLAALGEAVGRLHAAGLCHGDLTPSNILVGDDPREAPVLVDFGLGQFSPDPEAQGVDLHLLEEALDATDARSKELFVAFLAAYRSSFPKAEAALARLHDIRERGRYR